MERVAPESKDLAPRDIVARAIQTEILEGRGFEGGYVHLDLTHLDPERIKERLPGIREICMYSVGVDPIEQPIPVQPGQHYSMAGIGTKYEGDFCETDLPGLWVIGECACLSVHGANRLGGNSVLETAVFGRYVGRKLIERGLPSSTSAENVEKAGDAAIKKVEDLLAKWQNNNGKKPAEIKQAMNDVMDAKVGVFRIEDDLNSAYQELGKIQRDFLSVHIDSSDRRFNYGLLRTFELRNMLDLAETTAFAALWRRESRGSHFRTDYPTRNDGEYLVHSMITRKKHGLDLQIKPVILGHFEVKERTY